MKQHNYYSRGTRDNIIISNSSMSAINPEEGGDPLSFLEFFDENKEEKDTKSLNNGKVIHAYIEDKESFAIDELEALEKQMQQWADEILRIINNNEISSCEVPMIEEEGVSTPVVSFSLNETVNKLNFILPEDKSINSDELRNIIFQARANKNLLGSIKKPYTLMDKFIKSKDIIAYIMFVINSNGKFILKQSDKEIVSKAIDSLENNEFVKNKIFEPKEGFKMFKEIGILFKFETKVPFTEEKITLKGKVLIDNLQINFNDNIVLINDLKTTSKPLCKFTSIRSRNHIGSLEYYRYYRQLAWYKFGVNNIIHNFKSCVAIDSDGNKIDIPFDTLKNPKIYTDIIGVETVNRFRSGIVPVNDKWIQKGEKEIDDIVNRISWHIYNKNWNHQMEYVNNNGYFPVENP
jgi:hypothetical protein